jgi:hypothetical protein
MVGTGAANLWRVGVWGQAYLNRSHAGVPVPGTHKPVFLRIRYR